jgi:hypothetical protein
VQADLGLRAALVQVEQNRTDGRSFSPEIMTARRNASKAAANAANNFRNQIVNFDKNIADLQKFIGLESELRRAQDVNEGLTAARDLDILDTFEKNQLSAASRRILAEFEAAKKVRVDGNDAQKLADQLAAEQRKAEDVLFAILNPAIAERNRREQEARDIAANVDALTSREEEESNRLRELDEKRLRELADRFDNLPLDEFIDKINAERTELRIQAARDATAAVDAAIAENEVNINDENKKIKDTLDEFTSSIFGTPTFDEQRSRELDEEKITNGFAKAQDIQIDDLIEAHEMQKQAAAEIAALEGIVVK